MQILNKTESVSNREERVTLYGVTWEEYDTLGNMFTDRFPGLRMTYLEGILQLMNVSLEHERLKTIIARLIEIYAVEKRINLNGYGNATFKNKAVLRGLEPDECYSLGEIGEMPDIAIEIAITSGGINKLSVYQGLGITEVWFWQNKQFVIYRLVEGEYQQLPRSQFLPELDFSLLSKFVDFTNQTEAVIAYQDALR